MTEAAGRAADNGETITDFRGGCDYHGEVRNGQPDGVGVGSYSDEHCYSGEWRNGTRHGLGSDEIAGYGSYAGQWEDDRRHGLGVGRDPEGSVIHAGWWNQGEQSQTAPPR
eukprot:GHVU01149763.1.p3 GENE.GHVU01149763.1~~GHVU01149763.1.p3  ORF type:complete len:111 (-),score=10.76 GHVU01149763.1:19-351(-)